MNAVKNDNLWIISLSCLFLIQTLYGSYSISYPKPESIEISSSQSTIHLGEPFFLKVTYQYEKPPINTDTNDIQHEISSEIIILAELELVVSKKTIYKKRERSE